MEQIRFKSGEFQDFTATRTFAMGSTDVRITKGSELGFDGTRVNYGGDQYTFPQLRSAVSLGWVVPSNEYEEGSAAYNRPISANIMVGSAVPGTSGDKAMLTSTESDERIVMSTAQHAQDTRVQNRVAAQVKHGSASPQLDDGVPVRTIKTPARQRTSLTAETAGDSLRKAEKLQVTMSQGPTAADMMARMSEDQREEYLAKKAAHRREVPGEAEFVERNMVSKVKNTNAKKGTSEGITAEMTYGGGVETYDAGGGDVAGKVDVTEENGIKFTNTNGPKRGRMKYGAPVQASVVQPDFRYKVALSLCPEFPLAYDFRMSVEDKLRFLRASYAQRPDVLMACYAAESDEVKAALQREFPQAFA